MAKEKIIQVCDILNCDNKPIFNIEVGNKKHNFCCQKGFEQTIKNFNEFLETGQLSKQN